MKRLTLSLAACAALLASLLGATPAAADFGLKDLGLSFTNADGSAAVQAGSHPFAMTTALAVNGEIRGEGKDAMEFPEGELRNLWVEQPLGLVGDPKATPRCAGADFVTINQETSKSACPDSSAVGYAAVRISLFDGIEPTDPRTLHVPVYNLIPRPGVAATLGFAALKLPVTIDVGVSPTPPYNILAKLTDNTQAGQLLGSEVTLWGNPADPAHDPYRGACLDALNFSEEPVSQGKCATGAQPRPFLTLPRSCGPLSANFVAQSWQSPALVSGQASAPLPTSGCTELLFGPTIAARPTTAAAQSPAGLEFEIDVADEGLTSPSGVAGSDIRSIVAGLPPGMTANPSAAEGLGACSLAEYEAEGLNVGPGVGCPESAKLGSVRVETPLLQDEPLEGSVYLARQRENPFGSLLALYVVFENPELGIAIKQAGRIEIDPVSGQLTSRFEDLPQLPFSHLSLRLRGGPRSPLINPPTCGNHTTTATLTPWSGNAPIPASSTFTLTSGPEGGPCPTGPAPFHPRLEAGSVNNSAGAYSPFDLRLTREDGEAEITGLSSVLPPGLVGKLTGLARCPEGAVEAARTKSGAGELAAPSCPPGSKIGRTLAGAGIGDSLTYVPGSLYLAGPYRGDPLSLIAITPALAGPFDLGTVAIRLALSLNPDSAEVEVDGAASDPIPRILEGIPLRLRDLRVFADRPQFILNPTSCDPSSVRATVFGLGALAGASSRYQASDCAALGFAPKLTLKLSGATRRAGHPAFKAVLTPRKGDANSARAQVTLPHSVFLDQAHIKTVCTRVQFAQGTTPGEKCPPGSIYGQARALTPLLDEVIEGPVFLRSSSNPLPDLVAALHSPTIDFNLVGRIDSVKGGRIRNTFDFVPDAPVSKFTLTMRGAKKGLLINSTDLCRSTNRAIADFRGQNGRRQVSNPALVPECPKGRGGKGRGQGR